MKVFHLLTLKRISSVAEHQLHYPKNNWIDYLGLINDYVDVASLKEFSTEANPDELTFGKLRVLKNGGVNRLSIGVQSFDEELLKKLVERMAT